MEDDDLQGGIPGSPAGDGQDATPPSPSGAESGGGAPPLRDREPSIPRERFDEVNGQLQAARQQLQALEGRFQQVGNIFTGSDGQPADPRAEALRQQLFQLVPGLKDLVDKRDDLMRAATVAPGAEQHMDAYWHSRGQQVRGELGEKLKGLYGDKPDQSIVTHVVNTFTSWLEGSPQLQGRYVHGDQALIGEFWTWYEGTILAPVRRQNTVQQMQRGDRVSRLPSRGPATPPPAPAERQKPKNADELWDQAFDRFSQETAG